jgi:hypothetical protein
LGTYEDIVGFEFIGIAFETFWTEPVTIEESIMAALHIFDEDLATPT